MAGDTKAPVTFGKFGLARVSEVADFLNISRSKVYAMMDRGALPYVNLDGSRRIRREDVHRYVEENVIGGQGPVQRKRKKDRDEVMGIS